VTFGNEAAAAIEAAELQDAEQRARLAIDQHYDLAAGRQGAERFQHAHHRLGRLPAARIEREEYFRGFALAGIAQGDGPF